MPMTDFKMTEKINWEESYGEILEAYQHLIDNGWIKPPVRTLIYQLNAEHPDKWQKKHYGHLTTFLQRKKDSGELEYGLFASDTGGASAIPLSMMDILKQIKAWKETVPLRLSHDGNLYVLFHEHEGMIPTLNKLFDYRIGSLSSQGQIRHEHLYEVLSELVDTLHKLKGNEIRIIGIADYDIYGAKGYDTGQGHIIRNHAEWITRTFPDCHFYVYGVTRKQIEEVGLDPKDEHQFDGWLQRYGLDKFRDDIRRIVGYDNGWDGMRYNRIVCKEHLDFHVNDINKSLFDIMNHYFQAHGESFKDMDFVSMFREEGF
jgi:hypothetical protein